MRHMNLSAAAVALFLALALPAGVSAQAVTCKDGTTASASGRGACSHHGGVASVAITVSCRDGSTATPGRGARSHHGGVGSATATRTRSSTRVRASETTPPTSAPTSSDETVDCRDGTTSTAGRGACSHHGGVGAPTARASTKSETGAESPNASSNGGESVACRDGTTSTAGRGACSHHGGVDVAPGPSSTTESRTAREIPRPAPPAPGAPADASARCKDGTYSHTAHRSGACSHHGGVQQWYKDLPVRWY